MTGLNLFNIIALLPVLNISIRLSSVKLNESRLLKALLQIIFLLSNMNCMQ